MNIGALVCAVIAFFVASSLLSCLGGGAILVALFAGAWAYSKIDEVMKSELNEKLNPKPEVWDMSMPDAWQALKETMESSQMVTGASGITRWHIAQEDSSRGILDAELTCMEAVGSLLNQTLYKRQIGMTVQMAPVADGQTCVQIGFQVFSPSGTELVETVIRKTMSNLRLRRDLIAAHAQLSHPCARH